MRPVMLVLCAPFTVAMLVVAADPWTPRLDDLSADTAYVRHVDKKGNGTTASFMTSRGRSLTCRDNYKPTGACPAKALKEAMATNEPLMVWHDTKSVFQAEASGALIIDYSGVYTRRRLLAALFGFLSGIPLLVAWGRNTGLVNRPDSS